MKHDFEFDQSAKHIIGKIRRFSALSVGFDFLFLPILVLLICGIVGGFINTFLEMNWQVKWLFALISWGIFGVFLLRSLKAAKEIGRNPIKDYENKYQIGEYAPLSNIDDVPLNGFGAYYFNRQKIYQLKIPTPKIGDYLDTTRATKLIILLLLGFSFALGIKQNYRVLFPEFPWLQTSVQNVEIWAEDVNNKAREKIEIVEHQATIIPQNAIIKIRIIGAQNAPIISFHGTKTAMTANDNGIYTTQFSAKTNGIINIKAKNFSRNYKIKVQKDKSPKINGFVKSQIIDDKKILLSMNVSDDIGLKSIKIHLKGRVVQDSDFNTISETMEIDIARFKNNEPSQLLFNSAKSALVGARAIAFLEIEDVGGNITKSHNFWLNLPTPNFNNDFAQALQEIRLKILRETKPYSPYSSAPTRIFEELTGQEILIDISSYIENAPKSIQDSYANLLIFAQNSNDLGIDALAKIGIDNALALLERARNTQEAKISGNILWEIIEHYSKNTDTKSKMSEAIENLKNALKSNENSTQIERLKQDLRDAIDQHISSLQQSGEEGGDMEVEDNSSVSQDEIEKTLSEISAQNSQSDTDQKLDELNQFLQNMTLSNQSSPSNGQSTGGEKGGTPLDEAQSLYDETKKSDSANLNELAQKQRDLAQRLGGDENADNGAAKDMEEAAKALENSDKESALRAQKNAIQKLAKALNNGDETQDPLGRKIDKNPSNEQGEKSGAGGNNDANGTKIPPIEKSQKSREIQQKLKEKLINPDNNSQEREYYEKLLDDKTNN